MKAGGKNSEVSDRQQEIDKRLSLDTGSHARI